MFIELTDILRCPAPHDEAFLVLIPDEMSGRSVRAGHLGCPVCHREYLIRDGVARFDDAPTSGSDTPSTVDAEALAAFLGLNGPGGYMGVVGGSSALGEALSEVVPGVHVVLVNPVPGSTERPMMSLLQAGSIPIKSRSLRGVVLLSPFADRREWQGEAVRSILPGLRVVGQGEAPTHTGLEVLGRAGGWWVAQKD
jgi:uncharacterized protein YbaR (Trm112 family)